MDRIVTQVISNIQTCENGISKKPKFINKNQETCVSSRSFVSVKNISLSCDLQSSMYSVLYALCALCKDLYSNYIQNVHIKFFFKNILLKLNKFFFNIFKITPFAWSQINFNIINSWRCKLATYSKTVQLLNSYLIDILIKQI